MPDITMTPVAIYARVSSERQYIENSISAQIRVLKDYANSHGHPVAATYVDEAKSGRIANRPMFREMIAAAEKPNPPFEIVLVWKFSRFFRDQLQSMTYKAMLRQKGITVSSINEPVENSPSGRMTERILESIAEFESENLAQDVRRGMEEAALRGAYLAARPPYGYNRIKVPDGRRELVTLQAVQEEAETVREVFRLCGDGAGLRKICQYLNHMDIPSTTGGRWNIHAVRRVLTNPAYVGTAVWGRTKKGQAADPIVCPGAWEAIVSQEDYDAAQAALTNRKPRAMHPAIAGSPHLLSGLMRCGVCGMRYQAQPAKMNLYTYYVCGTIIRRGAGSCPAPRLSAELVENKVFLHILTVVLSDGFLGQCLAYARENQENSTRDLTARFVVLEAMRRDVASRLQALYEALESKSLDLEDLAPRIKVLRANEAELESGLDEVNSLLSESEAETLASTPHDIRQKLPGIKAFLKGAGAQEVRPFMHALVEEIIVHADELEVAYTIPVS